MLLTSCAAPGMREIRHLFELAPEVRERLYGTGGHTQIDQLAVGEFAEIEFEFVIGETAIQTGGALVVAWLWPFDWGRLQSADPQAAGCLHVEYLGGPASEGAAEETVPELSPKYEWFGGPEPWHHYLQVNVNSGLLLPGSRVLVRCGDRSQGGPGWRAPTCSVGNCGFLMLVAPENPKQWLRLTDPPPFALVPGPPARLLLVAPSQVLAGERCALQARLEDRWGNPVPTSAVEAPPHVTWDEDSAPHGEVLVAAPDLSSGKTARVWKYHTSLRSPGVRRACAAWPSPDSSQADLQATSNPIVVLDKLSELKLFWGDVHSGQTEIGCGCGSLAEHYAFGRDVSAIQFQTHQANDHYVTLELWNETRNETDAFYEPGQYVPILGCEWSPPTRDGGDRNVFYLHDEPRLRRSGRFFTEDVPDPEPDLTTAPEFLDVFKDLDVLINMHVGGRPTNLDWHEPKIEKLCEIHSTHGTSEWFVMDALSRGYRFGITAGTDGVSGRPGADHPGERLIRNVRNGLTAVYAQALTREGLWEAFHARRTYGTTGERIVLWTSVDGHAMGSELATDHPPTLRVQVAGTGPLERIDVLRGTDVVHTFEIAMRPEFSPQASRHRLRVLWGGTERKGTARLQRVDWDGSLKLSEGRILSVELLGKHSPADVVQLNDERTLEWRSRTAGNVAGVILELEADGDVACEFTSGPAAFEFSLSAALASPIRIDAGGVGRFVEAGAAPAADAPAAFQGEWTDAEPVCGVCPYWVRVVQLDQARAWSSPVYVTRE